MGMTVTTVTLEGFIFSKNYILLDCFDKQTVHVSNTINKYSEYHKGIEKIEIFKKVRTFDDLFKFIKVNKKKINQKKIDKQIDYFYYKKNKNYQKKIIFKENKIL